MGRAASGREPASQRRPSPVILSRESWCDPGAEGRPGPEEVRDVRQAAEQWEAVWRGRPAG